MATIASFRDEVDLYVKRASVDTTFLDDQIVKVIRDFCSHTWMWRITLDAFDVVVDTPDYALTIPDTDGDAELHMVDWVKYKEDGADDDQYVYLEPKALEAEEQPGQSYWPASQTESTGDSPLMYWVNPDDTLTLNPTPNSNAAGTENCKVKVIVKPIIGTTTDVPDFLYDDWVECIAEGVAGRILNMASKKWYAPELSDRYSERYQNVRNNYAKTQLWQGKTRVKNYARPLMGFTGGSRSKFNTYMF